MKTDEVNNTGSEHEPAAIDWSVLDSLGALQKPGKPDLRRRLMTVYLESQPTLMERLKTAVKEADAQGLMGAAHAMKSSSVSIGAHLFGKTCAELEHLGRTNHLEMTPAVLCRAETEFISACAAFRYALEQDE